MEQLHPSIEKLIATAPNSAVAAAIGREGSLSEQLEAFAGIRLVVWVEGVPRSLIKGRWNDCAEVTMDMLCCNQAAGFAFFVGTPVGRELAFQLLCRERNWDVERAHILHGGSVHSLGTAYLVPGISVPEADELAFRLGLPGFLYVRRGEPVKLVVTG